MKKSENTRILFVLIPSLALSLAAFVAATHRVSLHVVVDAEKKGSSNQVIVQHERQGAHGSGQSALEAALRLIINCNPFRK